MNGPAHGHDQGMPLKKRHKRSYPFAKGGLTVAGNLRPDGGKILIYSMP